MVIKDVVFTQRYGLDHRWYGKDEVPWRGTPSQGSPWAMPGEEQLLGALAVRVWGPIVKGQG